MKQTLVTYPGLTVETVRAELQETPAGRKALRLLGVLKVMEGKQTQDVAAWLNHGRHAITGWLRRVNESGLAGLTDKPGRGRKPRLTAEQRTTLAKQLRQSPRLFGFGTNLWTGPVLREHIQQQCKVAYPSTRVYGLLKELGFTLQRPTKRYLGGKPDHQQTFKQVVKKNHP